MKKLFKKGFVALTLMLCMSVAVPQQAYAHDPIKPYKTTKILRFKTTNPDVELIVAEFFNCRGESGSLYYYRDSNGNILGWWVVMHN